MITRKEGPGPTEADGLTLALAYPLGPTKSRGFALAPAIPVASQSQWASAGHKEMPLKRLARVAPWD